jgi:uncharacterized protein (TIGR03032 family)
MQSFASQHTESFAEFLRQAGVSLVVSTYQAGQLVVVRPQEQGVNTHFVAMSRPMGIAVEGGTRLTIGDAHRIDFYRNLPAVGGKIDLHAYDAAYLYRATHVTGDIDIHEMGYDNQSRLWLVNTRMSCLCTLADDASVVPQWHPPFISGYDLLDRCHLNGLGFRDGAPRYVSMLGASDEPGGWRRNKTQGGRIMDIGDDSLVVDGLCMPHSPRWYRDQVWFLASGEGALKRVESDGSVSTVVELPGFTRGLTFFGRYALVGLSQVRETAVFAGLPLTQRVEERQCGVYLVDIETGKTVGFLHFIGDVREIFDLGLLPHRAPTVVDANSPLLASSYELPQAALQRVVPGDPVQDALAAARRAHAAGELDKAIAAYREILEQRPTHRQARHNLGLALVDAERWEEGSAVLAEVVAEQADNADALNSLGLCLSRLRRHIDALEYFERAIAVDRQFALAHFNRGLTLLKLGRFAEGWREYAWRWQLPGFTPFRCPQPEWQGEAIGDKRLLVHSEQGNGDQMQFWRYIAPARERCAELVYAGPEMLSELAAGVAGVDESRIPGNIPRDRFDCYVPLMNLPQCLGMREPMGMAEPYVKRPPHVRVRALGAGFKVGIAWQGSATHKDDRRRSITLAAWQPLFALSGPRFFSMQFPVSGEEIRFLRQHGVENLEPEIHGYSRTAAFVEQLDLVICVDTALAHLAGAMGKPTWLLLDADADWRWGLESTTSAWYPETHLMRRAPGTAWDEVVQDCCRRLQALQTVDA